MNLDLWWPGEHQILSQIYIEEEPGEPQISSWIYIEEKPGELQIPISDNTLKTSQESLRSYLESRSKKNHRSLISLIRIYVEDKPGEPQILILDLY